MPLPSDDAPIRSYEDARAFLFGRIDYERAVSMPYGQRHFKLDRMRELLRRLDNPQQKLPIVHIAGTKGKGSTAAMTAAVLQAAGHRTGIFSSPHLERIEERMVVDRQCCSGQQFAALAERLRPVVAEMDAQAAIEGETGPTYFELTTAMALLMFVENNVDIAVLEVGLGGRLDSTNVCEPRVCVITSISYDHQQQLGNTLEAIAREKAGIIKPGIPVVSGVIDPEPQAVIREICQQQGCRLIERSTDFDFRYHWPTHLEECSKQGTLDVWFGERSEAARYRGLAIGPLGEHQGANAAVTIAIVEELRRQGWVIEDDAVCAGLSQVDIPARIEVVARRPAIVIDVAHNAASIAALLDTLDRCFSARQRLLVFATTAEKDIEGMLRSLLARFDRVMLTKYSDNPRGVPAEHLAAVARSITGQEFPVYLRPADALTAARAEAQPEDLICITGSFFIAAELRRLLPSDE